jgi:hypothetical protein
VDSTDQPDPVRDTLECLELPDDGSVWVGPYEQLHGARFSLLGAKRHGIYARDICDYHVRVRTKIVALILQHDATGQVEDKSALDNALAGFYFNAAIQRVVWPSERLIKTFVGIPCACGRPPEAHANSRRFGKLFQDAKVRIEHIKSEDKNEMARTAAMLDHFPQRETQFDPRFALAMLRYDVNNRRHAIFSPLARDRRSVRRNYSVRLTSWSSAPQNDQMQLACRAFEKVCLAYNEMRIWQPLAPTGHDASGASSSESVALNGATSDESPL